MSELASQSIGTAPILPETIALPTLGSGVGGHLDQLVLPMGEPALPFIRTGTHLLEGFAELCLVLENIGFGAVELLISLGTAVLFTGSPGCALEDVDF